MIKEPRGSAGAALATGHPAPARLAAFAMGEADAAAAQEVVRHLLRGGCRDCSRAILSGLPMAGAEDYDPGLDRAFADGIRRWNARRPPSRGDRAEAVLAEIGELAGLLPLAQGRRLLAIARGLRAGDPRWIGILCAFALAALEPLAGGPADDLRAGLWAELGNARRLAGELDGAAAAFAEAHRRAAAGGPEREAEVLELHAGLLLERGEPAGAAAILGCAQRTFAEAGTPEAAGRALVARGVALAAAGERGAAAGALVSGLELVAAGSDRAAAAEGLLQLTLVLAGLGRPELARPAARMARHLRRGAPSGDLPRERLLDGEVAAALGDAGPAARALTDARAGFAAAGRPYEALHAALRAAELELGRGRRSRAEAHLADALLLSSPARLHPAGRAALARLDEAVRRGRGDAALVRATAGEVRRLGTRSGLSAPARED